jgi:hypothetical protein
MTLDQLDDLAASIERRWGIDRLPRLMPEAWHAKFAALKAQLDDAISNGADTTGPAAALATAWRKMDEKATAQGSFPLDPRCVEVREDGQIFAVAPDAETARACSLLAQWEQREVTVYLAAPLIKAARANPTLQAIHAAWPGALVTALPAPMREGKRRMDVADEIPFPNPDAEDAA